MPDNILIYIVLPVTFFILLVLIISIMPFLKPSKENQVSMYYKLDIASRKITTILPITLTQEVGMLYKDGYESISLSDIKAFITKREKLPEKSFVIAINELYRYSLQAALPVFIQKDISITIFLPILVSSSSRKYQKKQVQQLNEFIFSDEFKNIFSYTQPNTNLPTTMITQDTV